MSEPTSPTELASAYFAALSGHDADAVVALVAEHFVNEHTGEMGDGCVGRAAYRERLPKFFEQLDGLHYDVERLIVDGSTVAALYLLTAEISSTPVRVRGVMVIDTEDGAITKRTDYWDGLTIQSQLAS